MGKLNRESSHKTRLAKYDVVIESTEKELYLIRKHSVDGNNSRNSRNGYNKKTIISDYGESEIVIPRDRNGEFEPKVVEKRQTRTDEIEQKPRQYFPQTIQYEKLFPLRSGNN